MNDLVYLWKDGKILTKPWEEALRHDFHFAYDPGEEEPDDRWGLIAKTRWWPRDVDSMPPEFKLNLLIMGVL